MDSFVHLIKKSLLLLLITFIVQRAFKPNNLNLRQISLLNSRSQNNKNMRLSTIFYNQQPSFEENGNCLSNYVTPDLPDICEYFENLPMCDSYLSSSVQAGKGTQIAENFIIDRNLQKKIQKKAISKKSKNHRKSPLEKKQTRQSHHIPSNAIRELKQSIGEVFRQNTEAHKELNDFLDLTKINSQCWGIDGILMKLLQMKDNKELISAKHYFDILQNFKDKLIKKQSKTNVLKSKNIFKEYEDHVSYYIQKGVTFDRIYAMYPQCSRFFDRIITQRKAIASNYLKKLTLYFPNFDFQQRKGNLQISEEAESSMTEKQETTNLFGELSIPFDLDDPFK